MTDSCERIMPELSAYLDGELSSQQRQMVKAHLETCPRCRAVLESYRAVNSQTMTVHPPEGFTRGVMERISREEKPESARKQKRIFPFRYGTAAAAMVALVLLGASGAFDGLIPRSFDTAESTMADNGAAAEEMPQTPETGAERIMSYSATLEAAPAEAAPVEEPAEGAPPESVEAAETVEEAAATAGATVTEEAEEEIIRTTHIGGTIINVEPSEGGYYVIISDETGEISVLLPWTALNEYVPQMDDTISLTAEVAFDGAEYHYVALDIQY